MTTKVGAKTFSGMGHITDGTLAAAVRENLAAHARRIVASLADITDNSGGTNDAGGLRKPTAFAAFQAGTTDAVAKAEFEAAAGNVRDAIKELVAQVNTIAAKAPAFSTLTDSMGGTAADGTIGAIDVSMTGTSATGATMVATAGANTVVSTLNDRLEQCRYFVNQLRIALGMSQIATEYSRPSAAFSTTFAAVSTSTGTATGGTNATTDATISKVAADAALLKLANNVKTLSTALNAMTADANANAALAVVAVA
jgi:hypothetical protein